jgi:hypothetical protein
MLNVSLFCTFHCCVPYKLKLEFYVASTEREGETTDREEESIE